MTDIVGFIVAIVAVVIAASVGGYATARSLGRWYRALPKPWWNPPDAVFGPVWTLLYLGMAVASWLVWRARDEHDVSAALVWYAVQLTLNVLWSVVFFGMRSPIGGLVVIVALWSAIVTTIVAFAPVSGLAAALLVPYAAWVTFASALNGAIVGLGLRPRSG